MQTLVCCKWDLLSNKLPRSGSVVRRSLVSGLLTFNSQQPAQVKPQRRKGRKVSAKSFAFLSAALRFGISSFSIAVIPSSATTAFDAVIFSLL